MFEHQKWIQNPLSESELFPGCSPVAVVQCMTLLQPGFWRQTHTGSHDVTSHSAIRPRQLGVKAVVCYELQRFIMYMNFSATETWFNYEKERLNMSLLSFLSMYQICICLDYVRIFNLENCCWSSCWHGCHKNYKWILVEVRTEFSAITFQRPSALYYIFIWSLSIGNYIIKHSTLKKVEDVLCSEVSTPHLILSYLCKSRKAHCESFVNLIQSTVW